MEQINVINATNVGMRITHNAECLDTDHWIPCAIGGNRWFAVADVAKRTGANGSALHQMHATLAATTNGSAVQQNVVHSVGSPERFLEAFKDSTVSDSVMIAVTVLGQEMVARPVNQEAQPTRRVSYHLASHNWITGFRINKLAAFPLELTRMI